MDFRASSIRCKHRNEQPIFLYELNQANYSSTSKKNLKYSVKMLLFQRLAYRQQENYDESEGSAFIDNVKGDDEEEAKIKTLTLID